MDMSAIAQEEPEHTSSTPETICGPDGKTYLASLDDQREVWFRGERVKNVCNHAAFRNNARMIARLYDALHDPERRRILTVDVEGNTDGLRTHRFYQAPRNSEEMLASRDAIAEWSKLSFGWIGRTPDYKAAVTGMLGVNAELHGPFSANALRWYDLTRRTVPFINHAIVHPPVDRQNPDGVSDVFVKVVRETDSGLIVSGAKVVATGAALTQHTMVAHFNVEVKDKRFSPVFMVPTNAPGVKLVCRSSYEFNAATTSSPFDQPLSSRMDENDAILILDKVHIPWEDVLLYGEELSGRFVAQTGVYGRLSLHGCTRLAVKLDFVCGLLLKAVSITGTRDYRGVQAAVGEVIGMRHLMWSLSDAIAGTSMPQVNGISLPSNEAAAAFRTVAADAYARIRNLIYKTVASALIYLPSRAEDFKSEDLRPYLDQYLRGSHGETSVERAKVMRALWDAVGTEFASRHELYEINYAGNYEKSRVDPYLIALKTGRAALMTDFADRFLAEYDLDGWLCPDLAAA